MTRSPSGAADAVGVPPVTATAARTEPRDGRMGGVTPLPARPVLDPIALGLLAAALGVSLVLVLAEAPVLDPGNLPTMLALTVVLGGYRVWLLVRNPDEVVRRVGFWPAMAVTAALVLISPVYGLVAFLGYLEAPMTMTGRHRIAAMLATAATCAAAQTGGPGSPLWSWAVVALFFSINVVIVVLIDVMERQRGRMVTDLERTVAELRESERRNAALSAQLVAHAREAGVQEERSRLSREIHDTVAQGLVGIITQLEAVEDAEGEDRHTRLAVAGEAARDALAEARRAVHALASPRLDDDSLPAALETLIRQTGETSGLDARLVVDGEAVPTPADAALLRVCQEALSNVTRHAEAERVVVTLGYSPDEVRLDVRDDGGGFDPTTTRSGHGLPGMRQRLAGQGGALEIETEEGAGCTISAAVPR